MTAPDATGGAASGVAGDTSMLSVFGERFMQMFDDYDEHHAASRKRTASSSQQRDPNLPAEPATGAAKHARSRRRKDASRQQQQQQHDMGASQQASPSKASKQRRAAADDDEIDKILQSHLKKTKQHTEHAVSVQHGVQVVDQSQLQGSRGAAGRLSIDMKAARRSFMSHKANKVHSSPVTQGAGVDEQPQNLDPSLAPEEFKQMALQIERLGGAALDDKKQRKQWKAQFLERLGAKPERLPRMAAKMGVGVAKKRAQREARALAEAIAAGTVRVKGMGKKKAAAKDAKRDVGLQEAGPSFKNGILRVRDPSMPQKGPKRISKATKPRR